MLKQCKNKAIISITLFKPHIQMFTEFVKLRSISEQASLLKRMETLRRHTAVAHSINSRATVTEF